MRTFQAERLAELEAERLKREQEEEEANNPMKASLSPFCVSVWWALFRKIKLDKFNCAAI